MATPYRGGAIAEFTAAHEWRIAGSIEFAPNPQALRGQAALDARLTVQTARGPVESFLGADGEFYLEGLTPGAYVLEVASGDIRCHATLQVPDSAAPVVRVGALSCVPTEGEAK